MNIIHYLRQKKKLEFLIEEFVKYVVEVVKQLADINGHIMSLKFM